DEQGGEQSARRDAASGDPLSADRLAVRDGPGAEADPALTARRSLPRHDLLRQLPAFMQAPPRTTRQILEHLPAPRGPGDADAGVVGGAQTHQQAALAGR